VHPWLFVSTSVTFVALSKMEITPFDIVDQ